MGGYHDHIVEEHGQWELLWYPISFFHTLPHIELLHFSVWKDFVPCRTGVNKLWPTACFCKQSFIKIWPHLVLSRVAWLKEKPYDLQSLKYLLSGPPQTKFSDFVDRILINHVNTGVILLGFKFHSCGGQLCGLGQVTRPLDCHFPTYVLEK